MEPKVKTIIEELLKKLSIETESIELVNHQILKRPIFVVRSKESGLLIGQGGEHFTAFNHLVRKLAGKQLGEDETEFSVDVNDYQESMLNRLRAKAKIMADRAVSFKSSIEMDPMTSFERMLVHTLLESEPNVVTESTGMGQGRRVVIKYIENKEPAELAQEF
ncbi:MAG: R3H domain-containing nucleic acid-binding protein [Candidatus Paceibacterota bacterium]